MENIMTCPPTRNSIAKEVEKCEESVIDIPPEWPECCIYRIPKHLRKVKEEAYTPKLVSIGPVHHRATELKDMEKHKHRYLKHFLDHTQKRKEDLRKIIEDNKDEICRSYSEDCGLESGDDFVTMVLLDAIFIIELFRKTDENKADDYILSKPWLRNGILHDLILLENQLPFFVLEKLYMFAFNIDSSGCNHCEKGKESEEHKKDLKKEDAPFVRLSRNYFGCYDKDKEPNSIIPIGEEVKHFTDLLRYLLCPPNMEEHWNEKMDGWGGNEKGPDSSKKQEESSGPNPKVEEKSRDSSKSLGIRFCATKLDEAGLKFEGKVDRRLLDIQLPGVLERFPRLSFVFLLACLPFVICFICVPCLRKCLLRITRPGCFGRPIHILEVPQLVIDDCTETLLRNLMALEQCHYPFKIYICKYVLLLDRLIDTEKDVNLLVYEEVIDNQLGSYADVASLINKLGDQIMETPSPSRYFEAIAERLDKHYKYPLNHIMATLKREYFPNVFRGTATVVGLIVLGFTFWNFLRPFVV